MALPRKLIVGWLASVLHSTIPPAALKSKPAPDTVTDSPFVRFVEGVTMSVAVASATAANVSTPAPEKSSATAKPSAALRRTRVCFIV
jgi:hypothetical protein